MRKQNDKLTLKFCRFWLGRFGLEEKCPETLICLFPFFVCDDQGKGHLPWAHNT